MTQTHDLVLAVDLPRDCVGRVKKGDSFKKIRRIDPKPDVASLAFKKRFVCVLPALFRFGGAKIRVFHAPEKRPIFRFDVPLALHLIQPARVRRACVFHPNPRIFVSGFGKMQQRRSEVFSPAGNSKFDVARHKDSHVYEQAFHPLRKNLTLFQTLSITRDQQPVFVLRPEFREKNG
jgi:hypothetical protein